MKRLDLLSPGQRLDKWVVVDLLGQGGMAAVYRVRHAELGRVAALKVVAVPSRAVMERLIAEGRSQSRVHHRNIVGVLDVLDVDGSPGLLMDYVAGPTLDALLAAVPLDLDRLDGLARGLLRGVAAAHEAGLVHRDLKPANILIAVEPDGLVPKVADFGLAKDFQAGTNATRTGMFMGTPNYMSPEQIRDPRSVDARSDLFSVGAILYEMVCGVRAFDGDDVIGLFNRIAAGDYRPVHELRPETPSRMVDAIARSLRPTREERPATCAALLAEWSGDVPDSSVIASYENLDPELLGKVRALVSVPPISTSGSDSENGAGTMPFSLFAEVEPAVVEPAMVAPARRSRWWLALPLAGFGAAGAACVGVGVVGAGLGFVLPGRVDEVAVLPPIAAPVPEAPTPTAPEPPPSPAPVPPPAPVARPVPQPTVRPAPVPAPVSEAPPLPPPDPAPVVVEPLPAVTTATVKVVGDARDVLLRADGLPPVRAGEGVPPGTYTVLAFFGTESQPTTAMSGFEVAAGDALVLRCASGLKRCLRER